MPIDLMQNYGWPNELEDVVQANSTNYHAVISGDCMKKHGDDFDKFFNADGDDFKFGEVCGHLTVLIRIKSRNISARGMKFIEYHEAFHIAGQIYGSRIPFDYLSIDVGSKVDPENSDAVIGDAIIDGASKFTLHLVDSIGKGRREVCDILTKDYAGLAEEQRVYLKYKAFWEWPAETYAVKKMGISIDHYLEFRDELFVNTVDHVRNTIYTAGPLVANFLAVKDGGKSLWWGRIKSGEPMIHIYLQSINCPLAKDFSANEVEAVRIKAAPLFENR